MSANDTPSTRAFDRLRIVVEELCPEIETDGNADVYDVILHIAEMAGYPVVIRVDNSVEQDCERMIYHINTVYLPGRDND